MRRFAVTLVPAEVDVYAEIDRLRRERNAIVLAHYYQDSEIQDLADFIGDSLQLANAAKATNADVIAFCGVHFMAETAKILNPDKIVVVPDLGAGCSLADGMPGAALRAWRAAHPDHYVITYINCSAEAKAASDIICTSSNARRVVEQAPADRPILFAPDRNLGRYLIRETGRPMDLWPGSCIVHETFSEARLLAMRAEHPDAKVLAHPECEEPILRLADFIGSTSALLAFAQRDDARQFIVATEPGILHQMRKAAPHKDYLPVPGADESCACNECPFMRLNTVEKLYLALRDLSPRLEMDAALREAARAPLDRMMALGS